MRNKYGYEEAPQENNPKNKHKKYGYESAEIEPKKNIEIYKPPKEQSFREKILRNIAVGLAQSGHSLLNTPHAIENSLTQLGEGINAPGKEFYNPAKKQNNILPFQEEKDFSSMVGLTRKPSTLDTIIQKGTEFLPEILGGYGIAKNLAPKVVNRVTNLAKHGKLKNKLLGIEEGAQEAESTAELLGTGAEEAQQEANLLQEKGNKEAAKYLNEGAAHAARGASALKHRIGQIEDYYKTGYKDLKKELQSSHFQMAEMPKYEMDMKSIMEQIQKGTPLDEINPVGNPWLKNVIDKAPTPKDTSASDFLTKYQDFRDARYELLQRTKDAKITASERKQLLDAYEESKPVEKVVKTALDEGLGPHKDEFNRLNKGYSEHVYPLRANKTARKALTGKLGPNTISELEGTGEGQEVMRELIKQDPELLRNIVGQRYAANPGKLHDISEASAEYLYEMPELRAILDETKAATDEKLAEVTRLKNQKKISLEKKVKLENEAKELKKTLEQIERDRNAIWKKVKTVGKYAGGAIIGAPFVKTAFNKITGQ